MSDEKQDLLSACEDAWLFLSKNVETTTSPVGIVLGGQPGVGKSNVVRKVEVKLFPKPIFINADDFRSLHPQFDEIQQQYGKDAPLHTGQFAGQVASSILQLAVHARLNIIIEGTFRNPETPINTLKLFKDCGYRTEAHIVTTPKTISWQSTIDRAKAAEAAGEIPRYVDKAIHDNIVSSLGANADKVFASQLADRFVVHSRESILFDSSINPGTPKQSIEKELNRLEIKKDLEQ